MYKDRILRLLIVLSLVVLAAFGAQPRTGQVVSEAYAAESPSASAVAEAATVRIDANGYFAGTGIVISDGGHVLTSVQVISGWRYAKYTVGNERLPAAVAAIDEAHGIAILCSSAAVGKPAKLATERSPKNAPVLINGFKVASSDPPLLVRRREPGYVFQPSFRGESSSALDLHDLIIVRLKGDDRFRPKAEGMPVISTKTGRVEGVVIGHIERSDGNGNDVMVMPASVAETFLRSKGVALP